MAQRIVEDTLQLSCPPFLHSSLLQEDEVQSVSTRREIGKSTSISPSFVHAYGGNTIAYCELAINAQYRKHSEFRNCTLVSRPLCMCTVESKRPSYGRATVLGHRFEGVASSSFGVLSLAWLFTDLSTSLRSSGVIVTNASHCLWAHLRGLRVNVQTILYFRC